MHCTTVLCDITWGVCRVYPPKKNGEISIFILIFYHVRKFTKANMREKNRLFDKMYGKKLDKPIWPAWRE